MFPPASKFRNSGDTLDDAHRMTAGMLAISFLSQDRPSNIVLVFNRHSREIVLFPTP